MNKMGLSLKIKSKDGQHILSELTLDSTIGVLKHKISEITKISEKSLSIKIGFPPKLLESANNDETLKLCGISNGETLIVDEKPLTQEEKDQIENMKRLLEDEELAKQLANPGASGILLKHVVPADNSCLFTSIGFVMNGKVDTNCGSFMRQIIAENVHNEQSTYTEGFLGRPNDEYCAWIMKEDSWGGAIEVAILSNFYGIEFDVVDITNALINRFGEDRKYGMRAFLLYDGIHYDPLYLESLTGEDKRTLFPIEEMFVYEKAEELANEAKSSRQFTDVDKFSLKCGQCDVLLKGQKEAQDHAKQTGHHDFREV